MCEPDFLGARAGLHRLGSGYLLAASPRRATILGHVTGVIFPGSGPRGQAASRSPSSPNGSDIPMSLAAPPGPCGAIWIENRPLSRIPGTGGRTLCTNFTVLRAPVRSRRTTRLKRPVRPTRRFWSISASGEARKALSITAPLTAMTMHFRPLQITPPVTQ
jgi:hypothetical protein